MATVFGLEEGIGDYPEGPLYFGINESVHAKYVTPVAKFEFFDSKGDQISGVPTIYIRMGGTFNTSLINSYSEERGIFGQPGGEGILSNLSQLGGGMIDAIQTQILKGVTGAVGFIGSAGLGGRRQVEFITRKVVNEFQQLVYTGPSFRRFQLPFAMKPVSETEAKSMIDIIRTFRIASSPIVAGQETVTVTGENQNETQQQEQIDPTQLENSEWTGYGALTPTPTDTVAANVISSLTDVLWLEYPRFCKLSLLLYNNNDRGELSTLFTSDLCAIETVAVDYGAQNKMTFFAGSDKYYPTDVTLTVALREAVLVTAGKASNDTGVIV